MMKRTKLPNKPGIYQIQSKVNGKIYVGSASNLKGRKKGHTKDLSNRKHGNRYLQRHCNKYGIKDLQFSILKFCSKEKLIEKEQHYINILKPEFNICPIAGSSIGSKRTEESKRKISKILTGKFVGQNNPMYGKHHSKETKQKISKNKERGKKISASLKGKEKSEEHKRKLSKALGEYFKIHSGTFLGKYHTEETKQKARIARLGKKCSEETKEKIRQWRLGHLLSTETKEKIRISNIGQKRSEETKQKMRENHADFSGSNNPNYGKRRRIVI